MGYQDIFISFLISMLVSVLCIFFSSENVTVRGIFISLTVVLLIYGVFFYIVDKNYARNVFVLDKLKIFNFICFGAGQVVFIIFAIFIVCSFVAGIAYLIDINKKETLIIMPLVSSSLFFIIIGMIISGYVIKHNYSQEYTEDFYIDEISSQIVDEGFKISWDKVEKAQRYFVIVNGKYIKDTNKTSCIINENINYSDINSIGVVAGAFGYINKRSGNDLEVYVLPKDKKLTIYSDIKGESIMFDIALYKKSFIFFHKEVSVPQNIKNLFLRHLRIQWFQNGYELYDESDLTYQIKNEDSNSSISLEVSFNNYTYHSNTINILPK